MTPPIVDTTITARAPIIRDPIIPALQAMAIAPAAVMPEAAATVEEAATAAEVATAAAAATRAVAANRDGCVVVAVPQLVLDSF
jgi:hypothetical protein